MSMGKADWQRLMDIAALCAEVKTLQQLDLMVHAVGRLVPHEFGAIGSFTTGNCDHLEVNFTTPIPVSMTRRLCTVPSDVALTPKRLEYLSAPLCATNQPPTTDNSR